MEYDTREMIQKLFDEDGLQDILLGVEEYFDNMDLYVFDNWIEGEVVEGPNVSKYWVEVTLKYPMDKLPDPRGTYMFHNQGTKIQVRKDIEEVPLDYARGPEDFQDAPDGNGMGGRKVKLEQVPVMLVKFTIPRRLVDAASVKEYELLDQELEQEELPEEMPQEDAPVEEEQPAELGQEEMPEDEEL